MHFTGSVDLVLKMTALSVSWMTHTNTFTSIHAYHEYMVHRIAELRGLAELNLSDECFQKYLQLIEPGIESMLGEYFKHWQNFEAFLSLSLMRHLGAFKTRVAVIQLDEDEIEKFGDQVEISKYRKVRDMSVFLMIEYLWEHQLIGPKTQEFFHFVRKRRNRIHTYDGIWSEEDRALFEWAWSLVHHVYLQLSGSGLYQSPEAMKLVVENTATALLAKVAKNEDRKTTFMFDSVSFKSKEKV